LTAVNKKTIRITPLFLISVSTPFGAAFHLNIHILDGAESSKIPWLQPEKEGIRLKQTYISIRVAHLILVAAAHLAAAALIGFYAYHAWAAEEYILLAALCFLLAAAFLANLYAWIFILWRVLYPVESLIDILYSAAPHPLPEAPFNGRHQTRIGKLAHILEILQENARRLELAAQALKVQKEYLQSILETIPDAIITIDSAGQIQMTNAAVEKTFGYRAAELIGQNVCILLTDSECEQFKQCMEDYLKTGISTLIGRLQEQTAKHKDGSFFPIELFVSELRYNSHCIFLGVIGDISERKTAEAKLERYLHDLESSNRELDDFAYIVSHDLKEPLRGLQSYSCFLLEDYAQKLDADGQDKLQTISALACRLETLLDTLLYYSRLGRTALAVCETDLDALVRDIIDTAAINLKEKNTTVELREKLPVIVCDHVRITEVFRNLITNAIKYNDKDGNIIEIGTVFGHPRAPEQTVFYVRDHGIGIAEKNLEVIFRMFKRLHAQNAYNGGTGSGLAIVKKIITQHGGEVWAESKGEGQGTCFFFTIPPPKKK
jgi:PAS domain S-box-containing protein